MKIVSIILICVLLSSIALGQEEEADVPGWEMSISARNIYIGETLVVNINGTPNSTFSVTFTPLSANTTVTNWTERTMTDANGTRTVEFDLEYTRNPGSYAISLAVFNADSGNDYVVEVQNIDVVRSDVFYNRILIHDLKEEIDELDGRMQTQEFRITDLRKTNDKLFRLNIIIAVLVMFAALFMVRMHGHEYLDRWVKWRVETKRGGKLAAGGDPRIQDSDTAKYGQYVYDADRKPPVMPPLNAGWQCKKCGFNSPDIEEVRRHVADGCVTGLSLADGEEVSDILIDENVERLFQKYEGQEQKEVLKAIVGASEVRDKSIFEARPSFSEYYRLDRFSVKNIFKRIGGKK